MKAAEEGRLPEMWPLKRAIFFETAVPGSFAAGDVRHGSAERYATAVGGGGTAVKFVNHILKQES